MKVKTLIEYLKTYSPDKQIQARDNTGDWTVVLRVEEHSNFVYIEGIDPREFGLDVSPVKEVHYEQPVQN